MSFAYIASFLMILQTVMGQGSTAGIVMSSDESQICMECKRKDTSAGFLYTFNFCPAKGAMTCVQDDWNYINS